MSFTGQFYEATASASGWASIGRILLGLQDALHQTVQRVVGAADDHMGRRPGRQGGVHQVAIDVVQDVERNSQVPIGAAVREPVRVVVRHRVVPDDDIDPGSDDR